MLKPHHLILLISVSVDGGTIPLQPDASTQGTDAGTIDAGTETPPSNPAASIQWPKDLRPLATLEGPAILAAHAVLQRVLSRFPKEYAGACEYSARSMDVVVGQEGGLYFVRIDRRADKCGWGPGIQLEFDWFELYAVSPDGRILARYPYMP
jgi:hypothetical protein